MLYATKFDILKNVVLDKKVFSQIFMLNELQHLLPRYFSLYLSNMYSLTWDFILLGVMSSLNLLCNRISVVHKFIWCATGLCCIIRCCICKIGQNQNFGFLGKALHDTV